VAVSAALHNASADLALADHRDDAPASAGSDRVAEKLDLHVTERR
jgi:hypothetical protein